MFSKTVALALVGAAAVQAAFHNNNNNSTNTTLTLTEVVNIFTTFCPEPTHLTMNKKTYTVTEACTFTITDCPCTITRTVATHFPSSRDNGNKGPTPTVAPPAFQCPGGKDCPVVVAGAGQNTAAYGMALAGAIAAAAIAL